MVNYFTLFLALKLNAQHSFTLTLKGYRMKSILVCTFLVLSGCSPEMAENMKEQNKPRVVAITAFSVTVSQYGNALVSSKPSSETIALANESCITAGKKRATWASYSVPNNQGMFDPEYMRNHQLFMCS